jgi:hypothetical protein
MITSSVAEPIRDDGAYWIARLRAMTTENGSGAQTLLQKLGSRFRGNERGWVSVTKDVWSYIRLLEPSPRPTRLQLAVSRPI